MKKKLEKLTLYKCTRQLALVAPSQASPASCIRCVAAGKHMGNMVGVVTRWAHPLSGGELIH
jgi:hypothetical protein